MAGTNDIKAGGAVIVIGGDSKQLDAALARASAKLKAFGQGLQTIGKQMLGVGVAIVSPLLLAGKAFASMGEEIYRASQRTGVSVEALSEMAYAARQSGVGLEELELAARKMQKSIAEAAIGSVSAQDALQRLGLTVAKLNGLSPEQQFKAIAESLSRIHDPTVKAAIAMEVFGRSGTAMIPLLAQGAAGIQKMQARAHELGLTLSTRDAIAAAKFNQALRDLTDVLKNGVFRIGSAVAPLMQRYAAILTTNVVKANAFVTAHKELFETVLKVGAGIVVVGGALFALGTAFSIASVSLTPLAFALSSFGVATSTVAAGLTLLLNPVAIVTAGLIGLAAYLVYTTDTGQAMVTALGSYFEDLKTTALGTFKGITDALASGDWALAVDVAMAGMKVAWLQGIAPLKRAWIDFTYSITDVAFNVFYGLREAWLNLSTSFQNVWSATLNNLADWWGSFSNKVKDIWGEVVRFISKGWISVQALFQKTSASELEKMQSDADRAEALAKNKDIDEAAAAARRAIDKETDAAKNARHKALTDDMTAREKAAQDELAKREIARLEEIAKLKKDRADALFGNNERANAEEAAAQTALEEAKAKAKLRALEAQAKTEAVAAARKKGTAPNVPNLPDPNDIAQSLSDLNKQVSTAGTFNPAAIFGLVGGGGSDAAKTARNTDKMAAEIVKHTLILNKIAGAGTGTFG